MSEAHTPGPWQWNGSGAIWSKSVPGVRVCSFECTDDDTGTIRFGFNKHGRTQEEATANAKLIAAAPDLLAALRPFAEGYTGDNAPCHVGISDSSNCVRCSRIIAARAAIAKAGGAA